MQTREELGWEQSMDEAAHRLYAELGLVERVLLVVAVQVLLVRLFRGEPLLELVEELAGLLWTDVAVPGVALGLEDLVPVAPVLAICACMSAKRS